MAKKFKESELEIRHRKACGKYTDARKAFADAVLELETSAREADRESIKSRASHAYPDQVDIERARQIIEHERNFHHSFGDKKISADNVVRTARIPYPSN